MISRPFTLRSSFCNRPKTKTLNSFKLAFEPFSSEFSRRESHLEGLKRSKIPGVRTSTFISGRRDAYFSRSILPTQMTMCAALHSSNSLSCLFSLSSIVSFTPSASFLCLPRSSQSTCTNWIHLHLVECAIK